MRHVALVGFMAAGKSTIGRRLARELGRPFVDTDELVVAARGSIADIFAREGATVFRSYELEAVREALAGEPAVVALGGGALTYAPTRELVAERARCVYLHVPAAVLLQRLRRAHTVRPVLGEGPTSASVRELLQLREPLYRAAEITVRSAGRSRTLIAREIATLVRAAEQVAPLASATSR
jgi:shikimate kinase